MGKGKVNNKVYISTALVLAAATGVAGFSGRADTFFVDGYHGGIYGHYPVAWKTQFIVDRLKDNPDWKIGLEIEPETWDTVQVRTPEAYEEFARMLSGGRMEYTNPTYAQPYCFNIEGESIIRQFSYGIEKLRAHFPDITFTTYSTEEPCFTSCLPAILKGFGFKYASLKCPNTCWGGYMAPYGGQLVNWIGPDGTSLLAVPRYACEELERKSVWQTTAWGNSRRYLEACRRAGIENPVGMCYQDAGWRNGPWLKDGRGSTYVLWTEYINNHTPGATTDDYHLTQNDVRVNLMWGSQVMQRIARQVRRAENNMLMAEKMGAFAALSNPGLTPVLNQSLIDEGWRQLMLAQHHDSWIVPYNGLWHFGTWADAIKLWTDFASSVARGQMAAAAAAISPGNITMVKVFNTTAMQRSEPVVVELPASWGDAGVELTDASGHQVDAFILPAADNKENIGNIDSKVNRLLFKATVPPAGYATYAMRRVPANNRQGCATATPRGAATAPVLENDEVRLEIDLVSGGTVKSLILKNALNGRDVEFAPADTCRYALGEMRGYFYDEKRFRSSTETPAQVVGYIATPHSQSITLAGEIAGHPYTRTYAIAAGSPRVDCTVHIDWQGNPGIGEYREEHWNHDRRGFCDDAYKLCFLLPTSFDTPRLWKDAPFDVCESTDSDTRFNRWSQIKHNLILNWVDAADESAQCGIGLISDHTTSYVHGGGMPLALTLQYSGQGLWGPNYRITQPSDVHFAIVPHAGTVAAEALADESDRFNEPLQAFVCGGSGKAETKSLLGVDAPGYRLSSAMAKNGSVEVRVHNTHATSAADVAIAFPGASVSETDLAGNILAPVSTSGNSKGVKFGIDLPRNGFATFKVLKNNAVAEFNTATH